ncbi:centromere protein U [Gracilinanus agilis]|uniref:centromere protein U n=1 Tax=Gracilinanus agilis TaxID=191870 RepID=UPI001CFD1216|nr:centromere protein U [Gracilinanus agilis]
MDRRRSARKGRNARAKEESKKKTGRQNPGKELNKKRLHLSGKIPFPEDLDLSVIGKVNETEQDEELGDSFGLYRGLSLAASMPPFSQNPKQQVTSRVCQRAIDSFYSVFKEQLIKMLTEVQRLKNLKRKNARAITDANKKRKCLFEAQEQQIRSEPQLRLLQRKYEELKHRRSSLREATWFLSNLQHLHDDYAALRRSRPAAEAEREQYGACSLPALLLEARGISGAAQHLRKINYRLQQLVDDK